MSDSFFLQLHNHLDRNTMFLPILQMSKLRLSELL